ncbi:MAG: hypothetical protein QM817_04005 [Archangium sp.]
MSAQSRFLSSFVVAVAVMSASGCICISGPTGSNGDISFTWTFNGRTCMQSQDIQTVFIQIPGQTLQNDGRYGCVNGGSAGIKLLNFRPGTYNYTITAQDSRGIGVFQATGRVVVNGDVVEMVDLKPTGNAAGTPYIAWTLPAGTNVTCQYLTAIDIFIDNETTTPTTTAQCSVGLYNGNTTTLQGVATPLAPGNHTVRLEGRDQAGIVYYRKSSTMTVNAAETTQQVFTLDWLVGTVALRFAFSNGVTTLNCAQALGTNQNVTVTFRDAQGFDREQTVPCTLTQPGQPPIDGYTPYIYAGTYQVFVAAQSSAGTVYNNFMPGSPAAPSVTAQAGVFPMLQPNSAPLIILSSQ